MESIFTLFEVGEIGVAYRDYYEILGIDRKATDKQIKAAYRKLAREHHPDLHAGGAKATAEEKFKEINEAYQVLSDPEKRKKYDGLGANWQNGQSWTPPQGANVYEGFTWGENEDGFSDFFEMLFGRAGRSAFTGGTAQKRKRRGNDLETEIALSVEEAYHGGSKTLRIAVDQRCPSCGGTGIAGRAVCGDCGGTGSDTVTRTLDVRITPGIMEGKKIRLKGQGGAGAAGGEHGDLLLTVRLLPHRMFTVTGGDVESTITVAPDLAVVGGKVSAPTLDGDVMLTVPPMSHSGRKLRLREKGWPGKNGSRGDHYVRIAIDIPKTLSRAEEEAYEHLAALRQKEL